MMLGGCFLVSCARLGVGYVNLLHGMEPLKLDGRHLAVSIRSSGSVRLPREHERCHRAASHIGAKGAACCLLIAASLRRIAYVAVAGPVG